MRPSAPTASAMPDGPKYMGWWVERVQWQPEYKWGNMGGPKQKGITQYSVSNYRLNAFDGAFKHTLLQGFSRTVAQLPYFLLPFAVAYGTISWAVKKNEWYNSKEGHLATAEHHD